VVVDKLDVVRAVCLPAEAHTPLVIDSNRELAFAISSEAFEPVAGNCSKGRQRWRRVERLKPAFCRGSECFECRDPTALREALGRFGSKRPDHFAIPSVAALCVEASRMEREGGKTKAATMGFGLGGCLRGCLASVGTLDSCVTRRRAWQAGLMALLGAGVAHAEAPPVWVWYRTSEGCPDGVAFVEHLAALGQDARLARVGDRVDFVVTLGRGASESSGRLERQTRDGTVAIQEYRDAECEHVAEALALTLDLALDPLARGAEPRTAAGEAAAAAPLAADAPVPEARLESSDPTALSFGVQATLASGIAPEVLPGAALFVELEPPWRLLEALRATLLGGYRRSRAAAGSIDVLLLSARLEGCPLEWRGASLSLAPCVGLEGGLLQASGEDPFGTSDAGFWGAALALGRLGLELGVGLELEAQVAGRLPLVRYDMGTEDGSAAWFHTRRVGAEASVGVAWRIP
jgi:hypothetical protein